jgi:hypothetical protein
MRMMKWLTPLFVANALVAGPLVQTAGAANADVVSIVGGGNLWPGLSAVPAAQAVNFNGDAVSTGTQPGFWACALAGNGLDDSYAQGEGILAGNCGPLYLSLCVYERVGVWLTLMCAGAGTPKVFAHGQFLFTPIQLPPSRITGFDLQGGALYLDAP